LKEASSFDSFHNSSLSEEMVVRPTGPTFYEILGVEPSDSRQRIRSAYVTLMKECHPDVGTRRGEIDRNRSQLINEAFNTLKDPNRRSRYDADLRYWRRRLELERSAKVGVARQSASSRKQSQTRLVRRAEENRRPSSRTMKFTVGILLCVAAMSAAIVYRNNWSNNRAEASMVAPAAATTDLLSQQPAILPAIIGDSVADFLWTKEIGSVDDAARYSRNCFAQLREYPNIRLIDRCVAFDVAWQVELLRREETGARSQAFFSPDQLRERHQTVLRQISDDQAAIEARLRAIASVTTSELNLALRAQSGDRNQPRSD